MKSAGSKLYLDFFDLTQYGIKENYLWKVTNHYREGKANSWANIKDEVDARKCLVDYDSIPEKTRINKNIPTKGELLQRLAQDNEVTSSQKLQDSLSSRVLMATYSQRDVEFFTRREVPGAYAAMYAKTAKYLEILAGYNKPSEVKRDFGITDSKAVAVLYGHAMRLIKDEWDRWAKREGKASHFKVTNFRKFQERLQPFKDVLRGKMSREAALESVICGKIGKQNAMKRTEESDKHLLSLYLDAEGIKLLPEQIHREYDMLVHGKKQAVDCETGELIRISDLPELSVSTVKGFFRLPEIVSFTARLRHGDKYWNDKFRPFVHGLKPRYSFSMTSSDGQHIGLLLKINGKPTWKRALAYPIFDVYSGAIVGCSFGLSENIDLMRHAFRNMLVDNNGLVPMENQLDNFGKGMEDELKAIYPTVSFCKPYNPQSKYAEGLIGQLESEHLRRVPGFRLGNIQDRKQDSKVNPDVALVHYTFEEVVAIYKGVIKDWNNSVPKSSKTGSTRLEMLHNNVNPRCERMSEMGMATQIGESTIVSIKRGFIRVEVDCQEYEYEIPNYTKVLPELKNGWKVRVRYLPTLLSAKVWIYNFADESNEPVSLKYDTFLGECAHINYTQRAKAEQTEADGSALGHQLKRIKEFDEWTKAKSAKVPKIKVLPIPVEAPSELSAQEAEAILMSGYTQKADMNAAEEMIESLTKPTRGVKSRWVD